MTLILLRALDALPNVFIVNGIGVFGGDVDAAVAKGSRAFGSPAEKEQHKPRVSLDDDKMRIDQNKIRHVLAQASCDLQREIPKKGNKREKREET